jgi:hypothetical protein
MNRNKLKTYAPAARREFIQAVKDRAVLYGLSAKKIEPMTERGDVVLIAGQPFPKSVATKRKRLEERIASVGFERAMEAIAYSWFNRFVAIRFMELHGYLDHGYRVLSHPAGDVQPEILEHAQRVDFPGLDKNKVVELKLDGTKQEELYRLLLVVQCNALSQAMPFLFERIDDETELLLPSNLLATDSLIQKLVKEIDEDDWKEVEILGWLYQFYISERKDEVIGKVVASEDIPAATQLFTPNWIVKYLVQNTLGRIWLATYPQSGIRQQMEFYIEPAEQTPEVQVQLKAITPTSLNPEDLTLLDPACGSAHILVEAYDLFKAIYQERGYRAKDIPGLILSKNLYGLEIDDRAAQLAAFALLMKARADDRRILESGVQPAILSFVESKGMDAEAITHALNSPIKDEKAPPSEFLLKEVEEAEMPLLATKGPSAGQSHVAKADIAALLDLFEEAKTFGSLIQIPRGLAETLPLVEDRLAAVLKHGDLTHAQAGVIAPLLKQAKLLARRYSLVVQNPPYCGSRYLTPTLSRLAKKNYKAGAADLFAVFCLRSQTLAAEDGLVGIVCPFVWMFLSAYEAFRSCLLESGTISSMVQLEYNAFEPACVPVSAWTYRRTRGSYVSTFIDLSQFKGYDAQPRKTLEAIRMTKCEYRFHIDCQSFKGIPRSPFAYRSSPAVRKLFLLPNRLEHYVDFTGSQNVTAKNSLYVRLWWEVPRSKVGQDSRWVPYAKGGGARRWWGLLEDVVDWSPAARAFYTSNRTSNLLDQQWWFRPGVTYSELTSQTVTFRELPPGCVYDKAGPAFHARQPGRESLLLAACNSCVAHLVFDLLNPTLHLQVADVKTLPMPAVDMGRVESLSRACVSLAKADWDEREASLEYRFPWRHWRSAGGIAESVRRRLVEYAERLELLKQAETQLNELFVAACGLQDELRPEVSDDQITLYRPGCEEDTKRLLSHAVGCMMGRYSLDKEGLIYAHSGNQSFDSRQYTKFPADDDGIIPVTESPWFDDDAANRFERFVNTAWPAETLEENLAFVAESLGAKKSETPRETIRRYFAGDFYKHHLQTYKNRPIYWLFSSGKQGAFEALVYLHRYNEGTLSRMRTEYVVPLLGKMNGRLGMLADVIAKATSTKQRKDAEKEKDKLTKQLAELQAFDDKLRHYADQRITLDLDDGVKVNYGKCGDLLADVKKVCGKAEEE